MRYFKHYKSYIGWFSELYGVFGLENKVEQKKIRRNNVERLKVDRN